MSKLRTVCPAHKIMASTGHAVDIDEALTFLASAVTAPMTTGVKPPMQSVAVHTAAMAPATVTNATTQRHGSHGQCKWTPIFRTHGYTLVEELGKGTFGTVCRSTNDATGEEFAIKALDLQALRLQSDMDESHLRRKTSIMKQLSHHNLCRLFDVVETPDCLP